MNREEAIQKIHDEIDPQIEAIGVRTDTVRDLLGQISDLEVHRDRRIEEVNKYFDALDVLQNKPSDIQ